MWRVGGEMDQPEAIRGKIFFDGAKKFFRHCPAGGKGGLRNPWTGWCWPITAVVGTHLALTA